jgi:hypothetical protein
MDMLGKLFPPVACSYTGSSLSYYFLLFITLLGTFRSLVHLFAVDGGANSIAGIALDIEGGNNIVAIFAQWGSSQLIQALVQWIVLLRYNFLVPAALLLVLVEQLLRLLAGRLKPLQTDNPPPGAIGTRLLIPIATIFLFLSLRSSSSSRSASSSSKAEGKGK